MPCTVLPMIAIFAMILGNQRVYTQRTRNREQAPVLCAHMLIMRRFVEFAHLCTEWCFRIRCVRQTERTSVQPHMCNITRLAWYLMREIAERRQNRLRLGRVDLFRIFVLVSVRPHLHTKCWDFCFRQVPACLLCVCVSVGMSLHRTIIIIIAPQLLVVLFSNRSFGELRVFTQPAHYLHRFSVGYRFKSSDFRRDRSILSISL